MTYTPSFRRRGMVRAFVDFALAYVEVLPALADR